MSPTVQRLLKILLIVVVVSPAIFTARLVATKTVDVGAWDMWEDAPLLEKWHDGTLTWGDLYAAQIQHRIVVPRLMIIAMAELSGGDFRWQCYACYGFVALAAVLVWLLLKRTLGDNPWRWPLMFAFNLLLFCPMHYQQLFWGACFWSLMPITCLLGAVLVLTPRERALEAGKTARGSWWRLGAALLLAEIATHSFAHGLATWPVIVALLLVNPALGVFRHRLVLSGIAAAVAGITIAFYFSNFINVAHHAYQLKPGDHAMSGGAAITYETLSHSMRFFYGFLGTWFARTPFVDRPVDTAVALGHITLILVLSLVVFTLRYRLWRVTLPWLAVILYVLIVGVMISKRGTDIDDHRAVTPRYLALSQHLLIASIALTATLGAVFRRARERWREKHPEEAAARASQGGLAHTLGIVLLTAFCVAQIPVWQYGLHLTDVWYHARRQGQATLLFLPHLKEQGRLVSMETLDKRSAQWDPYDNAVSKLVRIGLLRTRPLETPELKQFTEDKPLPGSKAAVTSASLHVDGTVTFKGHARFAAGEPVDAVLIVQNGRVISLGQPAPRHVLRIYGLDYEFSNAVDVHVEEMYPWQAVVKLPTLDAPVELWAFDVAKRRISRVGGKFVIDPYTKEVREEGRPVEPKRP